MQEVTKQLLLQSIKHLLLLFLPFRSFPALMFGRVRDRVGIKRRGSPACTTKWSALLVLRVACDRRSVLIIRIFLLSVHLLQLEMQASCMNRSLWSWSASAFVCECVRRHAVALPFSLSTTLVVRIVRPQRLRVRQRMAMSSFRSVRWNVTGFVEEQCRAFVGVVVGWVWKAQLSSLRCVFRRVQTLVENWNGDACLDVAHDPVA